MNVEKNFSCHRPEHPRLKAGILSKFTFSYIFQVIRHVVKKDFAEDRVYKELPEFKSKYLGDQFEKLWNEFPEDAKGKVFKVLVKQFFRSFLPIYLIYFSVKVPLTCFQPILIKNIVSYYKIPNNTSNSIYYNGAGLILVNIMIFFVFEHFTLRIKEIALQISVALASKIYRKTLKLKQDPSGHVGNMMTLITKDVFNFGLPIILFSDGLIYFCILIYQSTSIISKAGWIGILLYVVPFLGVSIELVLAKIAKNRRLQACIITAQRLFLLKEVFSLIQVVKLNNWENVFTKKIENLRNNEVKKLWATFYIRIGNFVIGNLTSSSAFYITIFSYVSINGSISAEMLYFLMASMDVLKTVFTFLIPYGFSRLAENLASLERLENFLSLPEGSKVNHFVWAKEPMIILNNLSINENVKDLNLKIQNKGLVVIRGSVGCGKTTLLNIIMEEIKNDKVLVKGTISYASQDPWIYPGTIKQNILFGQEYEEYRYREILRICALNFDLNHLERGDETMIIDDGVNLSKGQQTRINLARALYQDKQIYLLDSVFNGLDTKTCEYIYHNAIKDFLKEKICILITDNPNHCQYADQILNLSKDTSSKIKFCQQKQPKKYNFHSPHEKPIKQFTDQNDNFYNESTKLLEPQLQSSFIYKEDNEKGKLLPSYYIRYIKVGGGFLFVSLILFCFIASETSSIYSHRTMSEWINYEEKIAKTKSIQELSSEGNSTFQELHKSLLNKKTKLFLLYIGTFLLNILFTLLSAIGFFLITSTASKKIHKKMVDCVIHAKMEFFCSNLLGVILNRFSKDVTNIDEQIPTSLYNVLTNVFKVIGLFSMIALTRWIFAIPIFTIVLAATLILKLIFFPSITKIKRLESALHSPMVGHLNSTVKGIRTIRMHESDQELLTTEFDYYQDYFSSAVFSYICIHKGLKIVLSSTAILFLSVIVTFFMFNKEATPGDVGLGIGKSLFFLQIVIHILQMILELESNMTSMERICQYLNLQQEHRTGLEMDSKWPQRGKLEINNLNLMYKTSNEYVLNNVSFNINAGVKVAIVGRTGCGKSSLVSCLFRLYDFSGYIKVDGVDIKSLSLDYLRSRFGIVSQDIFIFSSLNLRENIDPLNIYSDAQIKEVIEIVMKSHKKKFDLNSRFTEDTLSSGEKQLISLARILLSKKQIIVFDEVTANIDEETSRELEKIIEDHFKGKTMIIVVHKFDNIRGMDKVCFLQSGRILEFDTPENLLGKYDSDLNKMLMEAVKK